VVVSIKHGYTVAALRGVDLRLVAALDSGHGGIKHSAYALPSKRNHDNHFTESKKRVFRRLPEF
jgi:hypothetical protein